MMYIRLTPHKTAIFTVFIFFLASTLAVSIAYVSTLPDEYLRLKGLMAMGKMPFQSIKYGINYTSRTSSGGFLASVGNLVSPAKFDVAVATRTPARDVPVLLYHGIVDTPDRFSMTPETFADQMFALKRAGYHTVTIDDFHAFVEGKKELDDKSFLLTFDDARIDAYFGADPVLQALGFTAVMYVATADSINVPRPLPSYYIHEGLLGRMIRSGRWEIGSHAVQETGGFVPIDAAGTKGNFLSNKKWLDGEGRLETDEEYKSRIIHELVDSKMMLEKSFGIPIISMAYPFGDYGQQTKNHAGAENVISEIVKANYRLGFRQVWPTDTLYNSNYPGGDPVHIRRIEAGTDWSGEKLLALIDNARAKDINFTDVFDSDKGWKFNWGKARIGNGELVIAADTHTTGSLAFLDGSRLWDDYRYSVTARQMGGDYSALLARFQDNDNYVGCWFSDKDVKITEKVNGTTKTLVKVRNLSAAKSEKTLGISVKGSDVSCYEGSSRVVSSGDLNPRLSDGGIGILTWDEMENTAEVAIRSLSVVPLSSRVEKSP